MVVLELLIAGAYVALRDAINGLITSGKLTGSPLIERQLPQFRLRIYQALQC